MDVPADGRGDAGVLGRAARGRRRRRGDRAGQRQDGPNRPAQGAHVGTASFMVALGGAWSRDRPGPGGVRRGVAPRATASRRSSSTPSSRRTPARSGCGSRSASRRSALVPDAFRLPASSSYADLHVMYLGWGPMNDRRDPPLPGQVDGWRVRCESVDVDARGLVGDRWFAVVDAEGKLGVGQELPAVPSLRRDLRVPRGDGRRRRRTVVGPSGSWLVGDPDLDRVLSEQLAAEVRVLPETGTPHQDAGQVSLVGTASLDWCREHLGRRRGSPADPARTSW